VFGEAGLSALVMVQVLALLVLFAAFFSAILLALTSFARSFKEAQAYLIPVMLLALAPGLLSLTPGLQFSNWLAVTPLVNIVLLARDVFEGTVDAAIAMLASSRPCCMPSQPSRSPPGSSGPTPCCTAARAVGAI
jgi:sodium transport system permease protein